MTKAFHRSSFTARLGNHPRPLQRLSLLNAGGRNRNVRWPTFDPRGLKLGILHFGCGAFHRAHQNVFTQRANELDGRASSHWGVVGVSFRSTKTRQLLSPQDLLYTVLERGPDSTNAEVVGVLRGLLFARDQRSRVIASLMDPQTRIVTLTVTPSGYMPSPSAQQGPSAPAIDPIGLLVDGLAIVRAQKLLDRQDIFGSELPQVPTFRKELVQAIDCLKAHGARSAVSRTVSEPAEVYA
jgi:fructuronate reductase